MSLREAFLANLFLVPLAALALVLARQPPNALPPILCGRTEWLTLALLVLVGVAMRTARWEVFPPPDGQLWEEAQTVRVAVSSLSTPRIDLYFPLADLTAEVGVLLYGVSLPGVRTVFVLLGIAAVPVFFVAARLATRSFFAAAFATGLFATAPMLAGSARIALETMSPIFTLTLALAALFYWYRRRDTPSAALAGAIAGLLLVEYDGYRLVPALGALFILATGLQGAGPPHPAAARRRTVTQRAWRSVVPLLVFALFAVLILAPFFVPDPQSALRRLLDAYRRHRFELAPHEAMLSWTEVSRENLFKVGQMAKKLLLVGGSNDVLPANMGVVDSAPGVLGVIAFLYSARRAWRDPVGLLLTSAIFLIVVLSAVLVLNPARYRLLPVIPFVFVAIGVFVDDVLEGAGHRRQAAERLGSVLLVLLMAVGAYRFFAVAIRDPAAHREFHDLSLVLAYEIHERQSTDPEATVYLFSDREFLAEESDYSVFYDRGRVRIVSAPDVIPPSAHGYVLAHDRFIAAARSAPGTTDCVTWIGRLGTNQLLCCRLVPTRADPDDRTSAADVLNRAADAQLPFPPGAT